jgi:outer membrane biosynthesis protein TonB
MINRTMMEDNVLGLDSSMKVPVAASILLHIIIFVLTAVGIPFIARDHEIISQPISVEIVTIDKLTQTNRVAQPVKPKEDKKDLPPPKQEKPAPPKMTQETPPDLSKPTPPDVKPEEQTPPVEQLAPPKPEKKEPVKPKEKPKPPKKEQTKAEKTKNQQNAMDSLLKDLTAKDEEKQPNDAPETAKDSSQEAAIAPLSAQLTMSEMDALRHQLGQCWNLGASAGGAYAEDQVVEVRVQIGIDRRVIQANVVDMGRYQRDPVFRAAAEAALRALKNPQCETLRLPPDKYNQWKDTVINFDPSDML